MLNRIQYALKMAWRHRLKLKAYMTEPALQCASVAELDPLALRIKGIKAIAVDFDGVLAVHGATEISKEIGRWLRDCIRIFGKGQVFILTNKPSKARARYCTQNFPGIKFIFPAQKKPYPDSLQTILYSMHLNSEELLVLDDRLLTGILAAVIAGVPARLVTRPLTAYGRRFVIELFIGCLRRLEQLLLR